MTPPTGMRAPVVVGLWPRVGAGTVAAALHAEEAEPGSMAADITVCSGDDAALRRAEALGGAAVLLIVLVDPGPPPSRARQRGLARRHAAVAVVPHVPHWAGLADVPDEAVAVLARRPEQLPPVLRAYAAELRQAVTAVVRGGGLGRPWPPELRWSRPDPVRADRVPAAPADRFARGRIVLGAPLGPTEPTSASAPVLPAPPTRAPVAPGPRTEGIAPARTAGDVATARSAGGAALDDAGLDDAGLDDAGLDDAELDDAELDDEALEAAVLEATNGTAVGTGVGPGHVVASAGARTSGSTAAPSGATRKIPVPGAERTQPSSAAMAR